MQVEKGSSRTTTPCKDGLIKLTKYSLSLTFIPYPSYLVVSTFIPSCIASLYFYVLIPFYFNAYCPFFHYTLDTIISSLVRKGLSLVSPSLYMSYSLVYVIYQLMFV